LGFVKVNVTVVLCPSPTMFGLNVILMVGGRTADGDTFADCQPAVLAVVRPATKRTGTANTTSNNLVRNTVENVRRLERRLIIRLISAGIVPIIVLLRNAGESPHV